MERGENEKKNTGNADDRQQDEDLPRIVQHEGNSINFLLNQKVISHLKKESRTIYDQRSVQRRNV